jgi:hypothetical protein
MSYVPHSYRMFLAASVSAAVVMSTVAPIAPVNLHQVEAESVLFSDVPNTHVFYDAITSLTSQNVLAGYKDGTFKPGKEVTRAEAAKILATALNLETDPAKVTDPGFKDVPKEKWYYGPIAALANVGLIDGYSADTFNPNGTLKRAEAAKLIAEAYNFSENGTNPFKDVKDGKWYTPHITSLYHLGITLGKTATTFAPDLTVNRGEFAAFVHRSQKKMEQTNFVVEKLENNQVTLNGKPYNVVDSLKPIFSAGNMEALKGAKISFKGYGNVISAITNLELKESGQASSTSNEYENHVVFDGGNAIINGNVKISADYITLKNMTVEGDLEISGGVKNSLYIEGVTINGNTVFTEAELTASNTTALKAVFNNSTLNTVDVASSNVQLFLNGSTEAKDLNVTADMSLTVDQTAKVTKLSLLEGAKTLSITGPIKQMVVESEEDLTITGSSAIENMVVNTNKSVSINTVGTIGKLESMIFDSKVTLNTGLMVGDVVVPQGATVESIILNYDDVKENIEKINNSSHPSYVPAHSVYELTANNLPSAGFDVHPLIATEGKTTEEINSAVESAITGLTPVDVKLSTKTIGKEGYEAVRIAPVQAGDHVQIWAKDTNGNWFDLTKTGWGPETGFAVPATYDMTTPVYILADQAGSYDINVKLVDVSENNKVLAELNQKLEVVGEYSQYEISQTDISETYTVSNLVDTTQDQASINAELETRTASLTPIKVTLSTKEVGRNGYQAVRILPINAGSNIQLWAKDDTGNWYDINQVGWGPSEGFELTPEYNKTTDVYVISDVAGTYTLNVSLVDLDNSEAVVAQNSAQVTVQ